MMKTGSLVVVGLGIKFKSHLTVEVETYIKKSDKVFYLANEPVMKEWIQSNSIDAESLDYIYGEFKLRCLAYKAMTERVLAALEDNRHVCFALYGHPLVYARPALDAVQEAKVRGFTTRILPGISAEDCLLADLRVNPGSKGLHSYEATDFLIHNRPVDPSGHLILWQVGIIGALSYPDKHCNAHNIAVLQDYLAEYYAQDHTMILYEAAQYPHFEPHIQEVSLSSLHEATTTPLTTLYIPPSKKAEVDMAMLHKLNLNIEDLRA